MKYIKVFEEHSDYEDFVSGGTMDLPNVSYCDTENEIHYNPYVRPNLCYMQVGDYYILCGNDGRIHRLTVSQETYYLGWNGSGTKLFHDMSASGNWGVISAAVATYGSIGNEISFGITYSNQVAYLTNNTFTWNGTDYVFSNGTWSPAIPGGEYIEPIPDSNYDK